MVTNSDVYGFWKDKKDAKKDGVRRFLPKRVTIRDAGKLENDHEEEVKYSIRVSGNISGQNLD